MGAAVVDDVALGLADVDVVTERVRAATDGDTVGEPLRSAVAVNALDGESKLCVDVGDAELEKELRVAETAALVEADALPDCESVAAADADAVADGLERRLPPTVNDAAADALALEPTVSEGRGDVVAFALRVGNDAAADCVRVDVATGDAEAAERVAVLVPVAVDVADADAEERASSVFDGDPDTVGDEADDGVTRGDADTLDEMDGLDVTRGDADGVPLSGGERLTDADVLAEDDARMVRDGVLLTDGEGDVERDTDGDRDCDSDPDVVTDVVAVAAAESETVTPIVRVEPVDTV